MIASLVLCSLIVPQGGTIDTSRPHRSFRLVYGASVPEVPAGAKQVRLWVPLPLDTPDQTIANIAVSVKSGETSRSFTGTPADGNEKGVKWTARDIQGGFGRSLCIESSGKAIELELAFDVTRYETKGGGKASADELAELRQPDKMIPLDGKVSAVAASLTTPKDPMETAHALYLHTLERMKYDKPEDKKGWGKGDAEWACDAKFGNCTDFHSYFMGLARTKGMAARFEMGFSVPGGDEKEAKIGGYHCWAYVWVDPHGWMPVDISEADKHPEKSAYFFGTLDADRVTMTGGRDVVLDPAPAEGALNFFVYPYAEVDGKKVENATRSFKRINL